MENASDTFRTNLKKRHAELRDRLERVLRDGRHAAGLDPDFEEQAVETENDDVLAKLGDAIRDEMLQVGKALERLDSDRYGTCETCGKPIPEKRLEALPYVTQCATCANRPGD